MDGCRSNQGFESVVSQWGECRREVLSLKISWLVVSRISCKSLVVLDNKGLKDKGCTECSPVEEIVRVRYAD